MRAVIEVAKLVEHLVEDLIEGEEIHLAVRLPKTELHLEAFSSFVHSMNGGIIRAKFGEKVDMPIVLAHNGLDQFGDILKNLLRFLFPYLDDSWAGLVLDGPRVQKQLRRWADTKADGEGLPTETTSRVEGSTSKEEGEASKHLGTDESHSREVRVRKVPSKFNDFVRV
ncbi:hypothetical protein L484_009666 [Morus notabilis]|uniref:Uncharacterized protein n=1 Tax=Morus notabilis TaxID=981085 RepID=W9RPH1_9ROSA|nr:hypothetical protein L484_009666 [Morus notabilis]